MPDLLWGHHLSYRRRVTNAAAGYLAGVAAAKIEDSLNAAGRGIAGAARDWWNGNSTMPASTTRSGRRSGFARIPRARRAVRSYRRGRRFGRRRYGRKRSGGIRGQFYARRHKLNTGVAVNDYRKYREQLDLIQPSLNSTAIQWTQVTKSLTNLPIAIGDVSNYSEFKYANVQVVVEPCFPKDAMSQFPGISPSFLTPMQGGILPVVGDNATPTTPANWNILKDTPGFRTFSLFRRTVINMRIRIHEVRSLESGAQAWTQDTLRSLGWMDTSTTPRVPFVNFYMFLPRLAAASTIFNYRVAAYVTTLYRGNKALLQN